jgi:hypothetical protein
VGYSVCTCYLHRYLLLYTIDVKEVLQSLVQCNDHVLYRALNFRIFRFAMGGNWGISVQFLI